MATSKPTMMRKKTMKKSIARRRVRVYAYAQHIKKRQIASQNERPFLWFFLSIHKGARRKETNQQRKKFQEGYPLT